jgi:hypothetical protein
MGQFSAEKPASPGSGTQATNPRRLQPELNFPTLVSRYFDNEMEQKAGKFMLINPPDAVPVIVIARLDRLARNVALISKLTHIGLLAQRG